MEVNSVYLPKRFIKYVPNDFYFDLTAYLGRGSIQYLKTVRTNVYESNKNKLNKGYVFFWQFVIYLLIYYVLS